MLLAMLTFSSFLHRKVESVGFSFPVLRLLFMIQPVCIMKASSYWMKWFMLLEIEIKLVQWHCLQLFPVATDQIYVQLPRLNNLMKTCSLIP